MAECDRARRRLPQYVADGEPGLASYRNLHEHLGACEACRYYVRRLRVVEEALRSYPLVELPPAVTATVLRSIPGESSALEEEWRLLPWDVWVPAAAFLLGLVIAAMSIPPRFLPAIPPPELESTLSEWPSQVNTWLAPLSPLLAQDMFWAVWIGVFVAVAGIGISLALSRWSVSHTESLNQLEARVESVASWVRDRARHAG